MYIRRHYHSLHARLSEERKRMQVLLGPRQVGKTWLARQVTERIPQVSHFVTADSPTQQDSAWVEVQWNIARGLAKENSGRGALLVLDEIQKVQGWSELVKKLWDEDSWNGLDLRVLLLGSSPLLMQRGLSESLAGRFELTYLPHWSFREMNEAFGYTFEQFVIFGGYPGAADLIADPERWSSYITQGLIETTISKDILHMTRVDKPALLRQLFQLGCAYSAQVLSYQKMLGQLQDAGNTTTLAHYLRLLEGAGMLAGIQKHSMGEIRRRASSPKLLAMNTGLITALAQGPFDRSGYDGEIWGRMVESSVGAFLLGEARSLGFELGYWRHRNHEVDYVLRRGNDVLAIEVKSGRKRGVFSGLQEFGDRFGPSTKLIVGADGVPVDKFLATQVDLWFEPTGFRPLGFAIPEYEESVLRHKFHYDEAPEFDGVALEPRLYLFVSVTDREAVDDVEHYHFARTRTHFVKGGNLPTWEDEFQLIQKVKERLGEELSKRRKGGPLSSLADPIFA